jgi:hypothetical protein
VAGGNRTCYLTAAPTTPYPLPPLPPANNTVLRLTCSCSASWLPAIAAPTSPSGPDPPRPRPRPPPQQRSRRRRPPPPLLRPPAAGSAAPAAPHPVMEDLTWSPMLPRHWCSADPSVSARCSPTASGNIFSYSGSDERAAATASGPSLKAEQESGGPWEGLRGREPGRGAGGGRAGSCRCGKASVVVATLPSHPTLASACGTPGCVGVWGLDTRCEHEGSHTRPRLVQMESPP